MKKVITLLALAFCFNGKAQIISTVAGDGGGGYAGDGGQATAAEISLPSGVALDGFGNFYIADNANNLIRKVSTTGLITTYAGTLNPGYSGDGGQATAAQLSGPNDITFDAFNNLYIADAGNSVIRKVTTAGIITTVAGSFTAGLTYTGDGGPATNAGLNEPSGVAIDALGNLYIADVMNGCIRKVNTSNIISTFAGTGTNGLGDGGQATAAQLDVPYYVTCDATGNLYISDNGMSLIRKVNTLGIISTVAGNGSVGFAGDGGQATAAVLYSPMGITIDATNNLYIADEGNSRIRKVNSAGIITTIAGNGTGAPTGGGFSGDGGQATAAEFFYPWDVSCDATGNLYIVDQNNNRIREVSNDGTTSIEYLNNNLQTLIYPNPTQNNFVIEPNSTDKQALQVFDVNGKLVLTQIINGKTNIDASSLAEGVYNLSLQNTNGVVNKRLVIVR